MQVTLQKCVLLNSCWKFDKCPFMLEVSLKIIFKGMVFEGRSVIQTQRRWVTIEQLYHIICLSSYMKEKQVSPLWCTHVFAGCWLSSDARRIGRRCPRPTSWTFRRPEQPCLHPLLRWGQRHPPPRWLFSPTKQTFQQRSDAAQPEKFLCLFISVQLSKTIEQEGLSTNCQPTGPSASLESCEPAGNVPQPAKQNGRRSRGLAGLRQQQQRASGRERRRLRGGAGGSGEPGQQYWKSIAGGLYAHSHWTLSSKLTTQLSFTSMTLEFPGQLCQHKQPSPHTRGKPPFWRGGGKGKEREQEEEPLVLGSSDLSRSDPAGPAHHGDHLRRTSLLRFVQLLCSCQFQWRRRFATKIVYIYWSSNILTLLSERIWSGPCVDYVHLTESWRRIRGPGTGAGNWHCDNQLKARLNSLVSFGKFSF